MKEYIKDIFSEETSDGRGKGSAKRFLGIIAGLLAIAGSIMSGLHWYEISPEILTPMYTFSAIMLGVSIVKGLFK